MKPDVRQSVRLIAVLTVVGLAIAFAGIVLLYSPAIQRQRERLQGLAQNYAGLIKAIASHEERRTHAASLSVEHGDAYQATLGMLCEAQQSFGGFGRTGELEVGKRIDDSIVYLVVHRGDSVFHHASVPFSRGRAVMHRALSGESGTGVLIDYRGVRVLAAYEPVGAFGLGVVAKLDLAEVMAPFINAGLLVLAATVVFVFGGGLLLLRATAPERRRLRESEEFNRHIIAASPDWLKVLDLEGRLLFMSDGGRRMLEIDDPATVLNSSWPDFWKGADHEAALGAIAAAKTGGTGTFEGYCPSNKGTPKWWHVVVTPMAGPDGKPKRLLAASRDITERKRTEEALRDTNAYLDGLIGCASAPIIIWDPDFRITRFNRAFERLSGRRESEIKGQELGILFPDGQIEASMSLIRRTAAGTRWESVEIPIKHVDGSVFTVLWNSATLFGPDGKTPHATIAQGQDITQRNRATEEIEWLSRFPEEDPSPVLRILADGTPVYANPGSKALLGVLKYDPGVRIPENWQEQVQKALSSGRHCEFEETCGDVVYSLLVIPVANRGYANLYGRDITEQKRNEQALRESEGRFRQLANSLPQLVWTCTPDGPCDFLSEQWLEYTGIPAEPQLGFGWLEQLHPDDREATVSAWNAAIASGSDFHVEFRIRRHDGEYCWFDTRAVRLRDAGGRTVKWFGTNTDITERKRAEKEKERLLREVERNKVELEQLIFAASHDLRTPLVGVQGFVGELELSLKDLLAELARPDVPPEFRKRITELVGTDIPESLRFIDAGVARMAALLSGLLRLSRMGRAALRAERLDMNRVVGDVVQSLEFAARQADAKLELSDLPACLGDPMQMGQVLSNLVENAFKYRNPDRALLIRITGLREGGTAVYCVEDNGIGIAPEQQQRIFTPFFRVDTKAPGGEGLGLTIVTRIVERLGGRVWVESEPGKGSRFYVELPTG